MGSSESAGLKNRSQGPPGASAQSRVRSVCAPEGRPGALGKFNDSSEVTEGVRKGRELGYLKGRQMGKLKKVLLTPRGAS